MASRGADTYTSSGGWGSKQGGDPWGRAPGGPYSPAGHPLPSTPTQAVRTSAAAAPPASIYAPGLAIKEIEERFMQIARRLVGALRKWFPHDPTVDRAAKRLSLAIQERPELIIETIGGYLWKYREQISDEDEAFFLENSYDAEIREAVNQEKLDYVQYLMPRVKGLWVSPEVSNEDRDVYRQYVLDMFDLYIDYLEQSHVS